MLYYLMFESIEELLFDNLQSDYKLCRNCKENKDETLVINYVDNFI